MSRRVRPQDMHELFEWGGWRVDDQTRSWQKYLWCLCCWGLWLPGWPPMTPCPGLAKAAHRGPSGCGCAECAADRLDDAAVALYRAAAAD